MSHIEATALLVVAVLGVWGLMYIGWRRRGRRDDDLPAPLLPPADPYTGAVAVYPGVYVTTTRHGDWLDRVVAHGLGTRSSVDVVIHADHLCLVREGARSVLVPQADLVGVGRAGGMAGKFVERDGLVVITWRLHGVDEQSVPPGPPVPPGDGDPGPDAAAPQRALFDTGIRLRRAQDVEPLTAALEELVRGAA